jgi:predicted DNA binding CopG/RHH family protein
VSLRFDENTIEKLKKIAESKGIGYLELVRMWVLEMGSRKPEQNKSCLRL